MKDVGRNGIKILAAAITLFVLTGTAFAGPNIINFGRSDYGAANKNWSIAQDGMKRIYVANDMGLLEFDGIKWSLYTTPNKSVIRSVAVYSDSLIFTGNYEDFGRWDRDKAGQLHYTSLASTIKEDIPKNCDFWKTFITRDGVIFQSFSKIYKYDFHSVNIYPSNSSGFLFFSRINGKFWAQKIRDGLYEIDEGRYKEIKGSGKIFTNTDVRVILDLGKGEVLLGTALHGLYKYSNGKFKQFNEKLSSIMERDELNCAIKLADDKIVFGTIGNGLYMTNRSGEIESHISIASGLMNNTILSLLKNDAGDIWAGMDNGIAFLNYSSNMEYYTGKKWNYGAVYSAILWQDKLIIGTNQGVFYSAWNASHISDTIPAFRTVPGTEGQTWNFHIAGDELYCCHNRGLLKITGNFRSIAVPGINTGIYDMTNADMNGKEVSLLATYSGIYIKKNNEDSFSLIKGTNEPFIKIKVDHLQNIWAEDPMKGIYRCRLTDDLQSVESMHYFGGPGGYPASFKLKLFMIGGRAVLLGDNRFYTYNDIKDTLERDDILNSCFKKILNPIRNIIHISQYEFLAISDREIYKFYYNGYKAEILGSGNIDKSSNLVYNYENAAILNDTTYLLFLDNGFLIKRYGEKKDKGTIISENTPARPYIKGITATNGKRTIYFSSSDQNIEIPHSFKKISFQYAAINMFASDIYFRYKVKGLSDAWSEPGRNGITNLERISAGNYEFILGTIDETGKTEQAESVKFRIESPWYETFYAFLIFTFVLFIIIAEGFLIFRKRYRTKYLRSLRYKEIIDLRKENKDLTDEIDDKNAEIYSQSSAIIKRDEILTKVKSMLSSELPLGSRPVIKIVRKVNSYIEENLNSDKDWNLFLIKFNQQNDGFFTMLKGKYPDLSSNDLKLCACLKLNMNSKDIASFMNLSVRAIENGRYRLRKKIGLSQRQNLNEFIMNIGKEES
ncbi:MAG: hypothetical protein LKI53_00105 [Bacteroidales bacterium]|jgi:DNA-binding CsgD family transcriptional regulator|nr:hypothetical protein [Bacteroidales bacterium]